MIAVSPAVQNRTLDSRKMVVRALLSAVLSLLSAGSSTAFARDPIQLGPAPELSVGSTTGDGVTLTVSDLRQEEIGDSALTREFVGAGKVFQVVHVTMRNRSRKTYYPSPLDFVMLDSDANRYKWWPVHRSMTAGFPDGKEVLEPGESASADVSFALPRSKTPAAIEWGTPSLIEANAPTAAAIGTRVVLIPDKAGHPVSSLRPHGPTGVTSQLGVTVRLGKAQVVALPASVGSRVPPGFIVETIAGTMENQTNGTLEVHTEDFIALDSRALPSAYLLRKDPLAMDNLYIKAGKTLSGNLTYIVPSSDPPIAIRWTPVGFIGHDPPSNKIIMLPH